MHGSLVSSSLIRETTENVSANLGYKFGQYEETYNIVAAVDAWANPQNGLFLIAVMHERNAHRMIAGLITGGALERHLTDGLVSREASDECHSGRVRQMPLPAAAEAIRLYGPSRMCSWHMMAGWIDMPRTPSATSEPSMTCLRSYSWIHALALGLHTTTSGKQKSFGSHCTSSSTYIFGSSAAR